MSDKKILYRTSDIYFSAFLMAIDINFIDMEDSKNEKGQAKKMFVFSIPDKEVGRLKRLFFGGAGTVRARRFVDELKTLKSMLHT